jgi:hypothetical protein
VLDELEAARRSVRASKFGGQCHAKQSGSYSEERDTQGCLSCLALSIRPWGCARH